MKLGRGAAADYPFGSRGIMKRTTISFVRPPATRIAMIAMTVVVLRLFAWEIHEISAHHGLLDDCFICVQAERTDAWVPVAPAVTVLPPGSARVAPAPPGPAPVLFAIARLARGPPAPAPS